ncbi:hypothetical protein F0562_031228 [Nyssa sinensis]|uniref:Kinesin motor domain-containing protein n=1 Tax=Nyssa sinensis TaxID=561372 RepID=A0A5J5AXM2_9ASTE|nr:hypothetical protein F0562_031228 [Nyssa sinensis]
MASLAPDPDHIKPNTCSNPCRKVRVVAKIRAFTDRESESLNGDSTPWISVHKPKEDSSDRVSISFGDQSTSRKDAYEVDYCYEQNEDSGLIFSREMKPLISRVFDGRNVSIIAYGARGSGKTYIINGSEEKPGLAELAMAEILSMAEELGKLVSISFYEVFQDHVHDLLDPKRREVQVLEDAQGKIKLKGLSQVSVKSTSEFCKLYFGGGSSHKSKQKMALELPRRSHKGLIIHISSCDENSNTKLVGKMNFVDLAGYEDARGKSSDVLNLVESTRINKSLYALLNVVYALNANESRIPYRESKLTRMLQDSLGGTNHVLMITCLSPSFCQDTVYTLSLASRSCQGINRVFRDSTKQSKSSSKLIMLSSLKNGNFGTLSATLKKQTSSRVHFYGKKASCMVNGRKLFNEGNHLINSKQTESISDTASAALSKCSSDIASAMVPSLEEEESISEVSSVTVFKEEETSLPSAPRDTEPTPIEKQETSPAAFNMLEPSIPDKDVSPHSEISDLAVSLGDGKENQNVVMNENGSPPLSARLQEISNNLKSLYSSTPLHVKMPQKIDTPPSSTQLFSTNDYVEPKTPVFEQNSRINDKWEIAKINSPWETFNTRSSRMKHSLVQEYLRFLNTASKEELKELKGIGEKRATYILELREESPEPFKNLDDLKDIGLSAKQVKGMMKKVAGELFS